MRHLSEMDYEEMREMRNRIVSEMIKFTQEHDFSGLSHAGWFSFYDAIDDAVEREWKKAINVSTAHRYREIVNGE